MKRIKKILQISALLLAISPVFVFSAQVEEYVPLAPLPGIDSSAGDKTILEKYLPAVFNLAVGLAAVMAFVMITAGGIMYATSDAISGKSQGKEYIKNAVTGLLIVIGSWVILYTINPDILNYSLIISRPSVQATSTVTAVRSAGLQNSTNSALLGLKNVCNCNVDITSSTGDSHDPNSLHYQGLAVDLRSYDSLTKYLTGQTTAPNQCTVVTKTLNGVNARFLWEPKGSTCGGAVASTGDHWHMSVIK